MQKRRQKIEIAQSRFLCSKVTRLSIPHDVPGRASVRRDRVSAPDVWAGVKAASVFDAGPRVMAETRLEDHAASSPKQSPVASRSARRYMVLGTPGEGFGSGQFRLGRPTRLSRPCDFAGLCEPSARPKHSTEVPRLLSGSVWKWICHGSLGTRYGSVAGARP